MATKRKGTQKTNASAPKRRYGEMTQGKRQLMSVIWFAVAVFFVCVVFIKGQNVWSWLHNLIFGIFGITAYFYPFLLGFIAVAFARDKLGG